MSIVCSRLLTCGPEEPATTFMEELASSKFVIGLRRMISRIKERTKEVNRELQLLDEISEAWIEDYLLRICSIIERVSDFNLFSKATEFWSGASGRVLLCHLAYWTNIWFTKRLPIF
jgi:hypothetical protein